MFKEKDIVCCEHPHRCEYQSVSLQEGLAGVVLAVNEVARLALVYYGKDASRVWTPFEVLGRLGHPFPDDEDKQDGWALQEYVDKLNRPPCRVDYVDGPGAK